MRCSLVQTFGETQGIKKPTNNQYRHSHESGNAGVYKNSSLDTHPDLGFRCGMTFNKERGK
jgi:hypothetical protein